MTPLKRMLPSMAATQMQSPSGRPPAHGRGHCPPRRNRRPVILMAVREGAVDDLRELGAGVPMLGNLGARRDPQQPGAGEAMTRQQNVPGLHARPEPAPSPEIISSRTDGRSTSAGCRRAGRVRGGGGARQAAACACVSMSAASDISVGGRASRRAPPAAAKTRSRSGNGSRMPDGSG